MKYIIGLLLAFNISTVLANDWHCRNHDVEISCSKGKCAVSEGTSFDVYFGDDGNMSIGMYTGVWEGTGKVIAEDNYLIVIGKNLQFSTSTDMKANFLILLDYKDKVAFIKGFGYAMPMICENWKKE